MNPILVATIDHFMTAPGVKNPTFTSAHMNGLITTMEYNIWVGNNRNMDSDPAIPVIIKVYMLADFSTRIEPHKS